VFIVTPEEIVMLIGQIVFKNLVFGQIFWLPAKRWISIYWYVTVEVRSEILGKF
jgi:hypothetical protein